MDALARKAESNFVYRGNEVGLSLAELASLLGERPHKLSRFVEAGVIEADRSGRFPIVRSVTAYWSFWRDVIAEASQRRRWRASGETLAGHAHRRSLEAR
jgi:hypothetical protein